MSSESSGNNNSSGSNTFPQRRGSITEYFRPPQPSAYPGPITTAAAQANHRRRMSFSGGLSGTSPPPWFGGRRGSMSSVSSTASSSAIDNDDGDKSPVDPPPTGSFARRLSFGARALRDVKRSMSFGTVGEGEPENEHRATAGQDTMPPPPPPAAPKPDEVQERILKGDFYF
ncbi:hypothetical protein Dda_3268 [Drechslerella dactyloides]|uniref:Uncharacterized protein n=1 Tax=Drechslerella dactyloides TaxID=74499 RepID=A0AAD6J1B3_DREDA|nr:hypothetical protein Dda_3268 [Drechslerella dactyloides]